MLNPLVIVIVANEREKQENLGFNSSHPTFARLFIRAIVGLIITRSVSSLMISKSRLSSWFVRQRSEIIIFSLSDTGIKGDTLRHAVIESDLWSMVYE